MTNAAGPRIVDSGVSGLRAFAASESWRKLVLETAIEFIDEVRSKVATPAGRLEGEDASSYLEALIPVAEREILVHHSAYGSIRWLWYLRRAPDELFAGEYGTTLGYDRTLAELVSWYAPPENSGNDSAMVAYKVDVSAFRHLARFVGRIKALSQLHQWYRRVGKGAVLDMTSALPGTYVDEAIDRTIRLYDARHDRSYEVSWSGLGLANVDIDTIGTKDVGRDLCITSRIAGSLWVPVNFPDTSGGTFSASIEASHLPKLLSIKRVLDPFGKGGDGTPAFVQELASLIQLLLLLPAFFGRFPWALPGTLRTGYFFVENDKLRSVCEEYLPHVAADLQSNAATITWASTYEDWISQLAALVPSLWPIRSGGVTRSLRNGTLIDVTAASQALLQRVEIERSPSIGNDRGTTFEVQCQQAIDVSTWQPTKAISAYRNRTLKQDGVAVTDIDAIACKARTLLVISCKSLIYDREYDRGTFRIIRNAQTTVDQAIDRWNDIVSRLRSRPVGDNFDLSEFETIIGVVCTPFCVYSANATTLAFTTDGLRACSSLTELREWLGAH